MLAALQADAEDFGRPHLARALHRLVLMTEVWECLRASEPGEAARVSEFCAEAFERITTIDDANDSEVADAVLRESTEKWGGYLALIETDAEPDADDHPATDARRFDPPPAPDDVPAAIDAETLLRLLTGSNPAPKAVADRARGVAPNAPSPEPAGPIEGDPWELLGLERSSPGMEEQEHADTSRARSRFEVPDPPTVLSIDPELRDIFLSEAADLFERIETLVLSLGRGPDQGEALHELGRCFHTLKGAAGSVDLTQLAALIHGAEEELENADGVASEDLIDLLHRLLHYLEGVFLALKRKGGTPDPVPTPAARPAPPPAPAPAPAPARRPPSAPPSPSPSPPREEAAPKPSPRAGASPRPIPATGSGSAVEPPPRQEPASAPSGKDASAGEGPLRVSSERIDELMDIVSELISRRGLWAAQSETMKEFATMARTCRGRMMATLDRIRDLRPSYHGGHLGGHGRDALDRQADIPELIRRLVEQSDDLIVLTEAAQATAKPLADNSDALARLTLQLWESLQAIRIVPVKGLFQRLMRVAHDAARVEGRHVEVVTVGEETGLDRAVQDKAFEPLLHIVRNSVCHGIERSDERAARGKPSCGRITLEATRTGNTLMLVVQDDGRGLDYEAIAAKGRRLGLIGNDDRPGVDRLNALVFQPGFSTREEANTIAGRGVGMDVVSQEVARLHGTVTLVSQQGVGTRLTIALPARLALEQAMVMRVDGQAFALPVELIERVQPFEADEVDRSAGRPVVRMREEPVPLVWAREALGLPASAAVSCPKVLLVRVGDEPLALVVDAIDGTRELVIKPLGPLLTGHPVVSGASLSVTGEVIFALSPSGLARWQREGGGDVEAAVLLSAPKRAPILVVDDSISVRKVVARHLRALGFEVEEVSDGLEALGKVRNHAYCLVLSDLEMPRMDGFELLAELGRLTISSELPVLIASTRTDAETQRRVMSLGARGFLSKPIVPEELAATVAALLDRASSDPAAPTTRREAMSSVS